MKSVQSLIAFCEEGIKDAECEYEYDRLGGTGVFRSDDAANDQGRIKAYKSVLEFIKKED